MTKRGFKTLVSQSLCLLLILLFSNVSNSAQDKTKLKPDEVIAKHLASLGTPETLAGVKSRLFQGKAKAFKVNSAINTNVQGKSTLASEGEKMLVLMNFETMTSADYEREQIGFDGKKFNIPLVTESKPSVLGDFVNGYKEVVRQGFLGGALMSNWALLDAKNKTNKCEYQGRDKVNGVETHVLKCVPRGGSGLTIKLFFDTQNFRHLRTTYYQETSPPTTLSDEGRVSSIRYKLIEDFANHKPISGLTLPTVYKIDYTIESPARLVQVIWQMDLSRFEFNVELKPELFQ